MRKSKPRNKRESSAARRPANITSSKRSSEHVSSRYNGYIGGMTFVVGAAIATFLFFANPYLRPFEAYWLVNAILLLWMPLTVILLFFKVEPGQFGLSSGDKGFGLKFTIIAILMHAAHRFLCLADVGLSRDVRWSTHRDDDVAGKPGQPVRVRRRSSVSARFTSRTEQRSGAGLLRNGDGLLSFLLGVLL